MTTKQRYDGVIAWFSEHMPVAESELHYSDPYQLLVAVILSAQCTDKRVNMTTPALFEAFPTPYHMARATAEEIYPYIRSISYPNNKARNLAGMARMLCEEFGGEVPSDLEQTLEKNIPGHLLPLAHHWLILHGRYVCVARAPKCDECGIATWCRKYASDHRQPKTLKI